ncbi:MAG: energy transducer TonB [Sulfuritalea sp.]|nr:energy transducer TonB [Sulfuritalea sp.]
MPLNVALLLSLSLHAAVIVAPIWLMARPAAPNVSIEARLIPAQPPAAAAEAVSTEAGDSAANPQPVLAPRSLQGSSLRRAQAALSEHLFYPPEAIAQGLEGDVILLLVLADGGKLISATVARSSGYALLDQAALDAARRIGALPGNPRQTLFPVKFRLQ